MTGPNPTKSKISTASTEAVEIDVRCGCGSLLARWTPAGLELKCRRCKRQVLVQIDAHDAVPRGPPRNK